MADPDLWAELSPSLQGEALGHETADPAGLELRAGGTDASAQADRDALGSPLRSGATAWSLDLDDPYAWQPELGDR